MSELKKKEVELLDSLLDTIGAYSSVIFKQECKETELMNSTKEKNEHYKNNSQQFQKAMKDCASIVANLSYDLKKELGILNNK